MRVEDGSTPLLRELVRAKLINPMTSFGAAELWSLQMCPPCQDKHAQLQPLTRPELPHYAAKQVNRFVVDDNLLLLSEQDEIATTLRLQCVCLVLVN